MSALAIPMSASSSPALTGCPIVTFALYAPNAKSAKAARALETHDPVRGASTTNGISGMNEPISEAIPTTRAEAALLAVHVRETVLLAHHHGDPHVLVRRDRVDDAIEKIAFEAARRVEAADFFALEPGHRVEAAILALSFAAEQIPIGDARRV